MKPHEERERTERVEIGRICKCHECECCKELARELVVRRNAIEHWKETRHEAR